MKSFEMTQFLLALRLIETIQFFFKWRKIKKMKKPICSGEGHFGRKFFQLSQIVKM